MREMNLTFRNPDEVLDFVKTVEQYPFDMDLCRGSVVVDAKSLLGIMNLGFNQIVSLKIYSNDCNELFQNIEKYKAA
ncbi:HPr family phosphocarrier protein [Clostridium sp. AM33-3]|uniref:HPr family phosphocarrier protein n=1 Tax=Clostridium sp. AM33-3 TaxID=2292304 RepID=UPI000E4B2212|nr:HPr family phosphocarrier protein [Clostridium sp. AM33-3]RHT19820.1 HPr family phosphocarrier protein [Clostridium sp. AM33-3]